jgi:hypothetical protein
MADAYKESGKLSVMAVSQSDPEETAALVAELGLTFPVTLDRDNYHSMLFGVAAPPVVYLTDANGKVLLKTTGFKALVLNDISARYAQFAEVEAIPLVEGVPATPAAALLDGGAEPLAALPATGESPTLVTKGDASGESPTLVTKGNDGESPTLVTKKD